MEIEKETFDLQSGFEDTKVAHRLLQGVNLRDIEAIEV